MRQRKKEKEQQNGIQAEDERSKHNAGSSSGTAPSKRLSRRRGYPMLPEQPVAARNPLAVGMVVAASLYCGAKAGIQVRLLPCVKLCAAMLMSASCLNKCSNMSNNVQCCC
jgi:hypothetical protein